MATCTTPHIASRISETSFMSVSVGELGVVDAAEVVAQDRLVAPVRQLVVDREVRQVEEGIGHPRVLPVEDADRAVMEHVGVQQVVVAEHAGAERAGRLDAGEHGAHLLVVERLARLRGAGPRRGRSG